jgi:hypothetical protein
VRGYTVVAALLDELAFWLGEDSSSPDYEILTALKPAMATVPGAMLLCASSPYARKGALWEAYHKNFGKDGNVLVWQAPTRRMNPTITEAYVAAEMENDPVAASAEYLGQFRTDIESFVSREAVEACVEYDIHERGFLSRNHYVAFVDPTGGSGGDSMTLAIAHKEGERADLDATREVKPPFSPEGVVQEFVTLLKAYKITKVTGDRYAGDWPKEQFAKRGIKYEASQDPKGTIYLNVLPLINSGKCRLLDNKRLVTQLISLERNTARGGRDSIDHPRGAHDDLANCVAGALLAATAKPIARLGAIGADGLVHWHNESAPCRVRYVSVDERGRELTTPEHTATVRHGWQQRKKA